jgi:hypothetical protein
MCSAAVLVALSSPPQRAGTAVHLSLPLDPGFVSATVDYMPGVGVLDLDLDDPSLLAHASALAPGLLRLGGSASDLTVFATNRSSCAATLAAAAPGGAPGSAYVCKGRPTHCLLAARWAAWLRFGQQTGLRVVLGLNGCFGRRSRDSAMDMSNVRAVLDATAAVTAAGGGRAFGFELGNELSECVNGTARWTPYNCSAYSSSKGVGAASWRSDANSLAAEARRRLQPLPPHIMGPDAAGLDTNYLRRAVDGPSQLSYLTYHEYPECVPPSWGCALANSSHRCNSFGCRWKNHSGSGSGGGGGARCVWEGENNASAAAAAADIRFVLPPDCLAQLPRLAHSLLPLTTGRRLKLMAGETADHAFGGFAGVTNRFADTLYYAVLLGSLSRAGVAHVARQTLVGGQYALLQKGQRHGSWTARPSYWLAWLWRRWIVASDKTSAVQHTADGAVTQPRGLYVFTFCSANGTGKAVVVNLDRTRSARVHLVWHTAAWNASRSGSLRREFHLTGDVSPPSFPTATQITLNGEVPTLSSIDEIAPNVARANSSLLVPPASVLITLEEGACEQL